MPYTRIAESPLVTDRSPVQIFYRATGHGRPLIFLHGGWGYKIYPFDRQIAAFDSDYRIVIPDRSGYGRSMRIYSFPADFHQRAAIEMARFLDSLNIDRPVLWGHSDGAVISVLMALENPERFSAIILEAFHFFRVKPGSIPFFETMASDPMALGERVTTALAGDHGDDYWKQLIINNGHAWLQIAEQSAHEREDLYGGRLGELETPALFIHGSRDPRTEPGELDAVRDRLPNASIEIIEGGGHSPHSESATAEASNRIAREFLKGILNRRGQ